MKKKINFLIIGFVSVIMTLGLTHSLWAGLIDPGLLKNSLEKDNSTVNDITVGQSANKTLGEDSAARVIFDSAILGETTAQGVLAAEIGYYIGIFLTMLGIISMIFVLYGAFTWITAGGNEEKISKAKRTIFNAVAAIVIILTSYLISAFVISTLVKQISPNTEDSENSYHNISLDRLC